MKTCYETAFGIFTFLNQLEIVLDYNDSLRSNIAEMFINTTEQKFLIYEKRDILFVDGEIDHAFSAWQNLVKFRGFIKPMMKCMWMYHMIFV